MGIVKRAIIYAAVEGLILHSHGGTEHHKSLRIDYGSHKITEIAKSQLTSASGGRLEIFGLIGANAVSDSMIIA